MILNHTGRIGKGKLRQVLGVQRNYKETKTEDIEIDCCNKYSCPIFQQENKLEIKNEVLDDLCKFCPYKKETKKIVYHNEKNYYNIIDIGRLSKIQLFQYLLYHLMKVDKYGIVKNIKESEIAETLNCSIKTIKNNNKKLVESNLIYISNSIKSCFNIKIVDYETYHLPSSSGGRGYVNFDMDFLSKLMTLKDVNEIRISCRLLLSYDDNNINREDIKDTKISYRDIKLMLPNYINCKKKIDRLLINPSEKLFNLKVSNKDVIFSLFSNYDNKLKIIEEKKSNEKYILERCSHYSKIILLEETLADMTNMSIEYGIDIVIWAIDKLGEYLLYNELFNYGGFIRNKIKGTYLPEINEKYKDPKDMIA